MKIRAWYFCLALVLFCGGLTARNAQALSFDFSDFFPKPPAPKDPPEDPFKKMLDEFNKSKQDSQSNQGNTDTGDLDNLKKLIEQLQKQDKDGEKKGGTPEDLENQKDMKELMDELKFGNPFGDSGGSGGIKDLFKDLSAPDDKLLPPGFDVPGFGGGGSKDSTPTNEATHSGMDSGDMKTILDKFAGLHLSDLTTTDDQKNGATGGLEKRDKRPDSGPGSFVNRFGLIGKMSGDTDSDTGMHIFKITETKVVDYILFKITQEVVTEAWPSVMAENLPEPNNKVKVPGRARKLYDTLCKDADAGGKLDGSSKLKYKTLSRLVEGFGYKKYLVIYDILTPENYDKRYDSAGNIVGSAPGDDVSQADLEKNADAEKKKNQEDYDKKKQEEMDQRQNKKDADQKAKDDAQGKFDKASGDVDAAQKKFDDADAALKAAKTSDADYATKKKAFDDAKDALQKAKDAKTAAKTDLDNKQNALNASVDALNAAKSFNEAKARYDAALNAKPPDKAGMDKAQADMDKFAAQVQATNQQ